MCPNPKGGAAVKPNFRDDRKNTTESLAYAGRDGTFAQRQFSVDKRSSIVDRSSIMRTSKLN